MDPSSSTTDELVAGNSVVNSARVLLWAKSHGPLAALALFVLYDGGLLTSVVGTIC